MRKIQIYQVDAFTKERFKGNPAGVVLGADQLSDKEMLSIARELNNSETAFVLAPDAPDHDVRIRFFTSTTEVPVCGHATVAAHFVRAIEQNLDSCTLIHKIGIGVLPVEILRNGQDYTIMMTLGPVSYQSPLSAGIRERLLKALGLSEEDLDTRCPIQIVSTGNPKVMIPIQSGNRLNQLKPNMAGLVELSGDIQCSGYFVFTLDTVSKEILTHGRMFAPAIGIFEDPVTGNANGPLGAYLVHHGIVRPQDSIFTFKGEQGEAIGRSGIVQVQVHLDQRKPVQVKIGGNAVIVFKTEILV